MKFRGEKTGLTTFYWTVSRQVSLFVLLIAFINTTVFPSFIFVAGRSNTTNQTIEKSENTSSLTEYLLKDCLQLYDVTPDDKEEDINDFEQLFDEVDLFHHVNVVVHFHTGVHKTKKYKQDVFPLRFSCFNASTPPPEC